MVTFINMLDAKQNVGAFIDDVRWKKKNVRAFGNVLKCCVYKKCNEMKKARGIKGTVVVFLLRLIFLT